ncbi:MAG: hypothetical protein WA924_15440 [Burkholderiaceae bacterium]
MITSLPTLPNRWIKKLDFISSKIGGQSKEKSVLPAISGTGCGTFATNPGGDDAQPRKQRRICRSEAKGFPVGADVCHVRLLAAAVAQAWLTIPQEQSEGAVRQAGHVSVSQGSIYR